ncbi:MAG TPA: Asp-tRNA(Asn)/Glu-tRNA(Gln) amidotransferase subunit GatB, partial [Smithella sp.]|nr:Asp-tRNA(Asn)/Glu-tRNA(Gln) amidotransferase subunit GatB [Smithella sp.]
MEFEAVIGLEIHVELNCATKLFCDCPNNPGDEPNANTCPTCLWFPGAVPRLSRAALEKAALLCLGLNAELQPESAFDQKVYYYPDLPKGYQLSQAHLPLSRGGWIDIVDEDGSTKRLRIHHIHMEEDVAKLVHEMEGRLPISLVDFNRAGAPLVEIVTEPDFRTPHHAMEFLKALRTQVRYVGSSECSMENGTMRVDANISVRPKGTNQMNTKVEVKNMNSIRHVGDAIAYEINRQSAAVGAGEAVVLHTRLWNPDKKATLPMRAKFEGPCVPDPTVPHIILSAEDIASLRAKLPEMPAARAERFVNQYGFSVEEATYLSSDPEVAGYCEAVMKEGVAPRTVMHWLTTQLMPAAKDRGQEL